MGCEVETFLYFHRPTSVDALFLAHAAFVIHALPVCNFYILYMLIADLFAWLVSYK